MAASLTHSHHGLFLLVVPVEPSLVRFLVRTQSEATSIDGERQWPYRRTAGQAAVQSARETWISTRCFSFIWSSIRHARESVLDN